MTKKTVDTLIEEAVRCLDEGEFERALQMLYLCESGSANPMLYHGKATTLFFIHAPSGKLDLEKVDEIISLYEQAIKMNPHLTNSYSMLGLTYYKKAALESEEFRSYSEIISSLHSAEVNLQKAMELDPSLRTTLRSDLESIAQKKEMYKQRLG
ncbi:MAG: hypothetical protein Q8R47_02695 [Nanoarchaeota archaeon]|nr:hypothetical protein [Nanoarchaeota archaeon]